MSTQDIAITKDLVGASAKPIILAILAEGENYGYEIIKRIREASGGTMQWKDGMLYPVLRKLEEQGCIQSEWRIADSGRKRKYYKLKAAGKRLLENEKKQWMLVHATLERLWGAEECLT